MVEEKAGKRKKRRRKNRRKVNVKNCIIHAFKMVGGSGFRPLPAQAAYKQPVAKKKKEKRGL